MDDLDVSAIPDVRRVPLSAVPVLGIPPVPGVVPAAAFSSAI